MEVRIKLDLQRMGIKYIYRNCRQENYLQLQITHSKHFVLNREAALRKRIFRMGDR